MSLWRNWTQGVFLLAFISSVSPRTVDWKTAGINKNQEVGMAARNNKKKERNWQEKNKYAAQIPRCPFLRCLPGSHLWEWT